MLLFRKNRYEVKAVAMCDPKHGSCCDFDKEVQLQMIATRRRYPYFLKQIRILAHFRIFKPPKATKLKYLDIRD